MQAFRDSVPTRTCAEEYQNYPHYKDFLRKDFNARCGYCNDRDSACGGRMGMHIDHFRPKSRFPSLINDYSNLVYSCPYCNNGKSSDWPGSEEESIVGDEGYIDPCDAEFDDHFERGNRGRICPKTPVGKYMYRHLKLGLQRHQLAWMYEQLETLLREVMSELKQRDDQDPVRQQLMERQYSLIDEYFKYKGLFEDTL